MYINHCIHCRLLPYSKYLGIITKTSVTEIPYFDSQHLYHTRKLFVLYNLMNAQE